MKFLIVLLIPVALMGQQPQPVTITNNAVPPVSQLYFYDANNNLQYVCSAPNVGVYTWAVTPDSTQGTLTSIAVSTNVGTATTAANHGLQIGNVVTVAGSTTVALNGNYQIKTVPSATTFTITTSGVADATYNTAALTLSSTAPRSNSSTLNASWSVQKFSYYGVSGAACPVGVSGPTNSLCSIQWALNTTSGVGGSKAYAFSCDARATLSYQ